MLKSALDFILYYDHAAWYYLNYQWHNGFLDAVLPYVRNQWFWVPLYFFLALAMPMRYRKTGLLWCLGFILSFIITDQISAGLMKPYFARLRPCNDPTLTGFIHSIVPCGGLYGFPSSHAANHFSIGVFSAVTLSRYFKWVWPVALFWAILVSYAQVYVGVHFPLDVFCGGMIGLITGIVTGKLFNRFCPLRES